jgi:MPBQ/MSBQ methyltransferase
MKNVEPSKAVEADLWPSPGSPRPNPKPQKNQALIVKSYDKNLFLSVIEEYYGHSDFGNWGYWLSSKQSQKEACETLVEKLLNMIPEKKGTVLDVACGKGATTRHLSKYYFPGNITGINISQKQLRRARLNAPGCKFVFMDATDLKFEDNCFDVVICVEAAFHFKTRQRFLSEAYRVLRPGGCLVLSDILFRRDVEKSAPMLHSQNWVANLDAYREGLRRAGFQDVEVTDATDQCAHGFDWHQLNYVLGKYRTNEIDWKTFQSIMSRRHTKRMSVAFYVLASGKKKPMTRV